MFTLKTALLFPAIFLAGCDQPNDDIMYQNSGVHGTLQRTTTESFSANGFIVGNSISLGIGTAFGVGFADGCTAYIDTGETYIKKKMSSEFCRTAVPGMEVYLIKEIRTSKSTGKELSTTYY